MPRRRHLGMVKLRVHHTAEPPARVRQAIAEMRGSVTDIGWPIVKQGGTEIPNFILTDPRLSTHARVLYAVMKLFAEPQPSGNCAVSMHHSLLACFVNLGGRALGDALKELTDRALIERLDVNHSSKTPTRYELRGG